MHPLDIWRWIPNEVRYYVARTGQMIGLTQRNYRRYVGMLLATKWNIEEIEMGLKDKCFDPVSGNTYFETKTVRVKVGSLIDVQWIHEQISEAEMAARIEAEEAEESEKKSSP